MRKTMKRREFCALGLVLFILTTPVALAMGSGPDMRTPGEPTSAPLGGTVEGRIVDVEDRALVVQTTDGRIVRMLVTSFTKGIQQVEIGDRIEATMSPEGIATSVHLRRKGFKR